MGAPLRTVLGHLQRHACREQTGALTDTELLCRYRTRRDEATFEALVWRHGTMVLAVCRRVAGHEQDAEDAFQAVFLTFARAAGSIRGELVGGWLYRVACRVARKARARAARHAAQPLGDVARTDGDPTAAAARRELGPVLDEEVGRLPAKYREAVVLCYLQGRTNAQAARELGWPKGTVATRLARARRLLRARLTRRGLALPAGSVALGAGCPPVPLTLDTIRLSLGFANGGSAVTDLASEPVAALTQGALRTMYFRHRLFVAVALVVVGLALTAAAAAAHHFLGEVPSPARTRQASAPAQTAKKPQPGPNRLLFYRQGHLTLIGPDGKNVKRVSEDRDKFMPGPVRLSPDGKRIAFLVQVERNSAPGFDPRRKLYVRGLDEAEPGTELDVEGQTFCWSPDGRQLVVTDRVRGDDPQEFKFVTRLVDVQTRKQTAVKLPDDQFVTDWSRDGKYFLTSALGKDKDQPTSRLHRVSRDGSEDRVLTAAGALAFNGRLSPDGGKVLYMAPDPERKGKEFQDKAGLFVLDVRRGKGTRVRGQPLNGSSQGYCWSPDGRRIAHTWRLDQGPQADGQMIESFLIVSDADGGNPVTIATEQGDSRGLITLGDPDWRESGMPLAA